MKAMRCGAYEDREMLCFTMTAGNGAERRAAERLRVLPRMFLCRWCLLRRLLAGGRSEDESVL